MTETVVVTGTFTDSQTIKLDQAITAPLGRVRLTVEPVESAKPRQNLFQFLDELRQRQAERGHVPRTKDEIDAALREDRDSWDN